MNTANDTILVQASGAHIHGFEDSNLSIIMSYGVNNVSIRLDKMTGTTNIANWLATDRISLRDSGFANPAQALAALKPTHFGQEMTVGAGKIEFLHNTPLTLASFSHVS